MSQYLRDRSCFLRNNLHIPNCLHKQEVLVLTLGSFAVGGLPFQIQRVSDTVKGVAVRVGGANPAPIDDTETTFPELQERIKKAIAIAESIKAADMNANEEKEVILPSREFGDIKITGKQFIVDYAIPNFFFHVMTAYAILRKEGVDVGKNDFLGRGVDLD